MLRVAAAILAGNLCVQWLPRLPAPWLAWAAMLLAASLFAVRCGLRWWWRDAVPVAGRQAIPDGSGEPRRRDLAGPLARGMRVRLAPQLRIAAVQGAGIASAAALAFGWTLLAAHAALADRLAAEPQRVDVVVTGFIADFPRHETDRSVFQFQVVDGPPEIPRRLRLSWYDPPQRPVAGQGLHVEVRLRAPRSSMNLGGRDFEQWMLVEGIGATGYLRAVYDADAAVAVPWLLRLRARLVDRLEAALGTERRATGILLATTVGAWRGISPEDSGVFTRTGTIHLVAISGAHVSLVAALGLAGFRRVWAWIPGIARKVAPVSAGAVAGLLLATGYALLAGFDVPVRRALLMLAVVLAALVLRRSPTPWQGLSLAAILVLAIEPLATLDVSFWLSFGAIAVIFRVLQLQHRPAASSEDLAIGNDREREGAARQRRSVGGAHRFAGWRRALLLFVAMQWLIDVGIAPALGAFFGQIPLVSPLANGLLIPVFSFLVIPPALIGAGLLTVSATLGTWVLGIATHVLDWIWLPLQWLAAQPWVVWYLPDLPALQWAILAVGCLLVLSPAGLPGRWLAVPLLAAVLSWRPATPPPGGFQLMFLDVGQGLSLWVRTQHHVLLFDAGPASADGFDAGSSTVLPALRAFGIDRIDTMVISHEHQDHAGGAQAILDAMPVERLLVGGGLERTLGGEPCIAGQRWDWDGVAFEILYPAAAGTTGNNASCVLSIRGDGVSALLTGDIEMRGERQLLLAGAVQQYDIVQVPHHGSLTSSDPWFVAAVRPQWALVGAGYGNQWNFPRAEVVSYWNAVGATVLTTGDVGAIELRAYPGGSVELLPPWRIRTARYWRAPTPALVF